MGVFNNFPYANFHELNADWIVEQVRNVMNEWEEYRTDMDQWKLGVDDQLAEFQAWFDNLDVQDEVRTVMNELILSGEFIEITSPQIVSATEAWLTAHITPTTPAVDDTLSISGAAADAKVTGDWISDLKEDFNRISEQNIISVDSLEKYYGAISNTGKWVIWSGYENRYILIRVNGGENLYIKPNGASDLVYAVIRSWDNPVNGDSVDFSTESGWTDRKIATTADVNATIPSDGKFLVMVVHRGTDNVGTYTDVTPITVKLNSYNFNITAEENIDKALSLSEKNNTSVNIIKSDLQTGHCTIEYTPIENSYVLEDGTFSPYANWSRSDYIEVYGGETLYFPDSVRGSRYNAFYDENKDFISSFSVAIGNPYKVNVPINAKYMCVSNTSATLCSSIYRLSDVLSDIMSQDTGIIDLNKVNESLLIQSVHKYNYWSNRASIPNCLSFAVFTDIHGDNQNFQRYMEYCENYSDYIDIKLCLGDMVANAFGDDISYWNNTPGADEIIRTIGNHDVWIANTSPHENENQVTVYNTYFRDLIAGWNVVQPNNAATLGLMYFYKDFTAQNVRLIVTDCMYWNDAELTWFEQTLESARTSGLSVICADHYNLVTSQITGLGNFYSLDYGFEHLTPAPTAERNAVNSFIANGGEFIAWLSGHNHYDACGVYTNADNGKQLSLTFENAGTDSLWGDAARIEGTKSQDSFNIVTIDNYSKLIKVYRVGNSYDRLLRVKNYIVYNYQTHEIIAQG